MMIGRNQILAVKRQILPVIRFAVCFSDVLQKIILNPAQHSSSPNIMKYTVSVQ